MNFKVQRNDITSIAADAIVIPANTKLKEGSGVSAAVFERAGRKQLTQACKAMAPIKVGQAIPTSAFNLPSKLTIHAVVPKWRNGKHKEYEQLSQAYLSALVMADQIGCESLAFPLLASGNMGFDLNLAAEIAVGSIAAFKPEESLRDVVLVTYGDDATNKLRELGYEVEEYIDQDYVMGVGKGFALGANASASIDGTAMTDGAAEFVEMALAKAKEILADPKIRAALFLIATEVVKAAKEGRLKNMDDVAKLVFDIALKFLNPSTKLVAKKK